MFWRWIAGGLRMYSANWLNLRLLRDREGVWPELFTGAASSKLMV